MTSKQGYSLLLWTPLAVALFFLLPAFLTMPRLCGDDVVMHCGWQRGLMRSTLEILRPLSHAPMAIPLPGILLYCIAAALIGDRTLTGAWRPCSGLIAALAIGLAILLLRYEDVLIRELNSCHRNPSLPFCLRHIPTIWAEFKWMVTSPLIRVYVPMGLAVSGLHAGIIVLHRNGAPDWLIIVAAGAAATLSFALSSIPVGLAVLPPLEPVVWENWREDDSIQRRALTEPASHFAGDDDIEHMALRSNVVNGIANYNPGMCNVEKRRQMLDAINVYGKAVQDSSCLALCRLFGREREMLMRWKTPLDVFVRAKIRKAFRDGLFLGEEVNPSVWELLGYSKAPSRLMNSKRTRQAETYYSCSVGQTRLSD